MSLLNVSKHVFNTKTTLFTKCSRFHTLQKLTQAQKVKIGGGSIQKRTFFSWFFRKIPITSLRSIDNVPKDYELMYRNDMDRFIQVTQALMILLCGTTFIQCVRKSNEFLEPETFEGLSEKDAKIVHLKDEQKIFLILVCGAVAIVSVMEFYIARLPVRIYYNPRNRDYIACLTGILPNTIKKQRIKIGEMKPIKVPFFSLWGDITYKHDTGYRFILFDNYFRRMSDLYIMLGLQEDVRAKGYIKPDDDK